MAQGQVGSDVPKGMPVDPNSPAVLKQKTQVLQKGGPVSGWFNMDEYIDNNLPPSGVIANYASFIFPDSNVIFIPDSDSGFYWYQTAVGSIFDPSDENMQLYTSDYFTRRDSYTWDSLSFFFLYRRGTIDDSLIDTLYIDLYDRTGLTDFGGFQGNDDQHVRPDYNATARRGVGHFQTITVLLDTSMETDKSAQGWSFVGLSEFVGRQLTAPAGGTTPNMVGFTLNFRPGYTWNLNDTMEVSNDATLTPTNTLSYIGYRQWVNEGDQNDPNTQIKNGDYYTHSLIQRKEQVRGGAVNGWEGYLPGNAFFQRQYVQSSFHFTGNSSVGMKDLNEFGAGLGDAYPNPTFGSNQLHIDYAVQSTSTVTIEVYDMFGNKVKTVVNQLTEAGEYTAVADISDLAAGVYVYTMTDGKNYASSKKVTIIK